MATLATQNPWLLAGIVGFLAFLLGVGLMAFWHRRQAGGQSVEQLRREMEDYRGKVSEHFATTSDLFRDMTEKYKDVYNHLANASQDLCEDPMEHGKLEFTQHKKLSEPHEDVPVDAPESMQTNIEEASPDSTSKLS